MHQTLIEVFDLLAINKLSVLSVDGQNVSVISKEQHVASLFSYLDLAGYLSNDLFDKAVMYLSSDIAFSVRDEQVKFDLKQASSMARKSGKFEPLIFCENMAKLDYLTVPDIIDLITFLQQTAFDRQFGEERDRLRGKPWMEEKSDEFTKLANSLGVTSPLPPNFQHYCGVGIMGAASVRANERINYFYELNKTADERKLSFDSIWALTGNRELSKGLDDPAVVEAVAKFYNKPLQYVKKVVGKDSREFADGITETMMVKYLIQAKLSSVKIEMIDSDIQREHWRATTQQSAVDIAQLIVDSFEKKQIPASSNDIYYFMIIAEQPYAGRMAKQVQRAFDAELKKRNYASTFHVEGCGLGVVNCSLDTLTRLNSELAALAAERFNDARIKLSCHHVHLRDPKIILFSSRDDLYQQNQNKKQLVDESHASRDLVKFSIFFDSSGGIKTSIEPAGESKNSKKLL
jgi:hypothetical protein